MSADGEQRRTAVAAIVAAPRADGVAVVRGALGDEDWRVRKEAVRAAAQLLAAGHDVLPVLVAAIVQGENVGARNAALEAIDVIGARATPALLAALDVAERASRKFLVEALGHAGGDGTAGRLVAALDDDDPNVTAAALDALARVGGVAAERALRLRLAAGDPFQRLAALDALDRLGTTVPFVELSPLLGERLLRRAAIPALGRTLAPEAITPLIETLADGPHAMAGAAAVALEHLAAHDAALRDTVRTRLLGAPAPVLEALRAALDAGARDAQRAAAALLVLARDALSLGAVVALVADETIAPELLAPLTEWSEGASEALLARLPSLDAGARAVALELCADLVPADVPRAPAVRAALLGGLADRAPRVIAAAARGLARHAGSGDAEALVAITEGPDELAAHAASHALSALALRAPSAVEAAIDRLPRASLAPGFLSGAVAALGGPRALERLSAALSAEDAGVRRAALAALATIDGRRAAELAAMALADERPDVRAAAANALAGMRDAAARAVAADALLVALRPGEAPEVQAAAARALGDLRAPRAVEPLRALVTHGAPMVILTALAALRRLGVDLGDVLALLRERRASETDELVREAIDEAIAVGEGGG